jgi:serine/threonine protein kinase
MNEERWQQISRLYHAATSASRRSVRPSAHTTRIHSGAAESEEARFSPGQLVASRYRIVRLLGRGGMGEVYQADDEKLGERVALKLLSSNIGHPSAAVERFANEVRLARGIAHPNVCRVYDIGESDGWHYLSMEYVDGETLASLLDRVGPLSPEKVADIARQVCAGLSAAHSRGVLHRDLKPANIMIDGHGYVRILDFGLAVALTGVAMHEIAGTPGYMSPEQLTGGPATERSDIYALGLVIHQLLTARLPMRISEPLMLDPRLAPIIRRCIAVDPNARPASASEVAALLPGKDVIASALDDGRVLSPTMIAAASAGRGLRLSSGLSLLGAAIAGILAVAGVSHRMTVPPKLLPKPPQVLANDARTALRAAGEESSPVDSEFWFESNAGAVPSLRFVYRQSGQFLVPRNIFHSVTADDPPRDAAAEMAAVTLATDGQLLSLTTSRANAPTLSPVETASRERQNNPDMLDTRRSPGIEALLSLFIVIAFGGAAVLARRHLRNQEADRDGARRVTALVAVGGVIMVLTRAHHVPVAQAEWFFVLGSTGWALVWAAFTWLTYLGLEPYARRWWPTTLASWTRALEGRVRDPMVGRDVLIGMNAGVALVLLLTLRFHLTGAEAPDLYLRDVLESIRSWPHWVAGLAFSLTDALEFTIGGLFLLVLMRLIFRTSWLAIPLWMCLVMPVALGAASFTSPWDFVFSLIIGALAAAILLRVGLLAAFVMVTVEHLSTHLLLTLDPDAWYFASSAIVVIGLVTLSAASCLVACTGRTRTRPVEASTRLN